MDQQFNFAYLRAKTIVQSEKEARLLAQDAKVALEENAGNFIEEKLYEELGKKVYSLGCKLCREKKMKEADVLELWKDDLDVEQEVPTEEQKETLINVLEKLPDLYFATVVAFYHDYMTVEEIAKVFDCTEAAVRYRLNYARKCLQEEMPAKAVFNPWFVKKIIRAWFSEQNVSLQIEDYRRTATKRTEQEWADMIVFANPSLKPAVEEEEATEVVTVDEPAEEEAEVATEKVVEETTEETVEEVAEEPVEEAAEEVIEEAVEEPETVEVSVEEEMTEEPPKKKKRKWPIVVIIILVLGAGVAALYMNGFLDQFMPKADNEEKKEPEVVVEQQEEAPVVEEVVPEPPVQEPVEEPVEEPQEPIGEAPQEETVSEYIFENSNKKKLKEEDLESYSRKELRLARNEIYARYGVIFEIEDLDEYFKDKSWYEPKMTLEEFYDRVEMSMVEEYNISLIRRVEESK